MTMSDQPQPTVEAPFAVPFLRTQVVQDESLLERQRERSREIVDNHDEGWSAAWASRCGSWNSVETHDSILDEEEVYSPILDNLGSLLEAFTGAMSMDWSNMAPIITESWLNANPPGNVQECHIHGHCYISAVYYIHVPEGDGGEFVMDNPLSYEHQVGCDGDSPYTDEIIDVQSGDLILFPSNIEHHTRVNLSDEFRYSLAFNISTEELSPQYMSDGVAPWDAEG